MLLAAPTAAASSFGGHWALDEVGSPEVAVDSSGNGNDGAAYYVVGDGSGYVFSGTGSKVVVPDSASLNPGTTDFSYSVTVITGVPAVHTDYDLMRKGLGTTTGGEFKAEIHNVNGQARALCLVKDATGVAASIKGTTNLDDGQPHTITCSKTATSITIRVDSLSARTRTPRAGAIGSISNTYPLLLGVKTPSGGDDFIGTMTDASVT